MRALGALCARERRRLAARRSSSRRAIPVLVPTRPGLPELSLRAPTERARDMIQQNFRVTRGCDPKPLIAEESCLRVQAESTPVHDIADPPGTLWHTLGMLRCFFALMLPEVWGSPPNSCAGMPAGALSARGSQRASIPLGALRPAYIRTICGPSPWLQCGRLLVAHLSQISSTASPSPSPSPSCKTRHLQTQSLCALRGSPCVPFVPPRQRVQHLVVELAASAAAPALTASIHTGNQRP